MLRHIARPSWMALTGVVTCAAFGFALAGPADGRITA